MDRDERSDTESLETLIAQWTEYTCFCPFTRREQTSNALKVGERENDAVREVLVRFTHHV